MSSIRAEAVAEILWELKKAEKLATYTEIAQRAGFSPGANGRTMQTCLKHIRKDWAHLEWWRAINDDLAIPQGSEQYAELTDAEFALVAAVDQEGITTLETPGLALLQWSQVAAS